MCIRDRLLLTLADGLNDVLGDALGDALGVALGDVLGELLNDELLLLTLADGLNEVLGLGLELGVRDDDDDQATDEERPIETFTKSLRSVPQVSSVVICIVHNPGTGMFHQKRNEP